MRKRSISLLLGLMILATGCSAAVDNMQQTDSAGPLDISWEIDYEVPTCTANVLVDREGYYTDRDKIVCFRGDELGRTFQVIDATTEEVAFTGKISDKQTDKTSGETVSQGDFSEFATPGTYYIETDIIGRSYKFKISDEVYDGLFAHMLENSIFYPLDQESLATIVDESIEKEAYAEQSNRKDVYEECMAITAQALAMQYYSICFEQEDGATLNVAKDMQQEAAWLLSMQQEDGFVYAGLYMPEESKICRAPKSDEATAAFCGSMVILSKLFESSDVKMSEIYLQAAKKAWRAIEQSQTVSESARFYASAWLFWRDGNRDNQAVATKYLKNTPLVIEGDRFALFGGLAYLSAEYRTDTAICAKVMDVFMDSAEKTATKMKEEPYLVYSANMEEDFERMLIVSIANYVVPSNEYVRVLENFVHYLLGRNANGYRYINEDGCLVATTDALGKTQQWDAIVRFMLCGILDAERDEVIEK